MATSDTLGEREGKTVILIAWYNWPRSQLIDKYWIYLPSQPVPCCTQLRSSTFIYNYYRWQEGIEKYHKPDFHSSLQIKIARRKAHLHPSPPYDHQLKNHRTAPTLCFSTTATSNEKKDLFIADCKWDPVTSKRIHTAKVHLLICTNTPSDQCNGMNIYLSQQTSFLQDDSGLLSSSSSEPRSVFHPPSFRDLQFTSMGCCSISYCG